MFNCLPKALPVTLLLSFLFISGCEMETDDTATEKPLRPVQSILIEAPDTSRRHEFTAVVDASRKADLSFKVSGEIIAIHINQGDGVKAGQVLARLDDTDIKLQLEEAQSSFEKSDADYKRAKSLVQKNMISKADLDQLKAQFNLAKARYDGAKNNLAYTQLKSPFDGVIAKKYSEKFQEVNAKQTVFTLYDISTINLKIDVPDSIMIHIRKGEVPKNLKATFDEIPGVVFPLKFKEASTKPDELTKTYEVTLTMLASRKHNILPGMTARVIARRELDDDDPANFFLPVHVVLKDSQGNFVYGVKDNNDGTGTITKKRVMVGEINRLGIEIYSGIEEGDSIISAGMSKVSDGMLVKY